MNHTPFKETESIRAASHLSFVPYRICHVIRLSAYQQIICPVNGRQQSWGANQKVRKPCLSNHCPACCTPSLRTRRWLPPSTFPRHALWASSSTMPSSTGVYLVKKSGSIQIVTMTRSRNVSVTVELSSASESSQPHMWLPPSPQRPSPHTHRYLTAVGLIHY